MGSGKPFSMGEGLLLLFSAVLILSPFIIFPATAYWIRKDIFASTFSNTKRRILFVILGAFPIILLVVVILPFTIYSGGRRLMYESYTRQLQHTEHIEFEGLNLDVTPRDEREKTLDITFQIRNLPETLSDCYFIIGFTDPNNPAYVGRNTGTITGTKMNGTWTFYDTEQRQQAISHDPNKITVNIREDRFKYLSAQDRRGLKIFMGTRYLDLNVPIKSFVIPIEIPEKQE